MTLSGSIFGDLEAVMNQFGCAAVLSAAGRVVTCLGDPAIGTTVPDSIRGPANPR